MRKAHSQDIAQVTQAHENRQTAGTRAVPEHIAEEKTSNENLRGSKVRLGDRSEVSNVGEEVENGDTTDCDGSGDGKGLAWVLELADDVVCVLPAFVAVDYVEESVGVGVCTTTAVSLAFFDCKGVFEVLRVGNTTVSSESSEASEDDDKENNDLEDTKDIE